MKNVLNVVIPKNEISALLTLIEDPDEIIYSQIKDKIISLGTDVVPDLENAWDQNKFVSEYLLKIENIIHEIQLKDVLDGLKNWKGNGYKDLVEGVLLINRYKFPELDKNKVYQKINTIAQDAKIAISENDTSLEKVLKLNNIIFQVHNFSGNRKKYYSDSNSYLSEVLINKKGNSLMLSIIYLEIANRLNIPISGVNLPNHFVLGYKDLNEIGKEFGEETPFLFYINPFSGGEVVYRSDIDLFLDRLKIEKLPKYYHECSNLDIIKRILANLRYSYQKSEEPKRVAEIDIIISLLR